MSTGQSVGLVMSGFIDTEFLPSSPAPESSWRKYFWGGVPPDSTRRKDLRLFQVHHRFSIMVSATEMELFSVETGKDCFRVEHSKRIPLLQPVKNIYTNWPIPFENVLVIICFQDHIALYTLDFEHRELTKRSSLKIKDINSMVFINGSTLWVVSEHSFLIEIGCNSLKLTKTMQRSINIDKSLPIHHGILVSPDLREKEPVLYYFFFTRTMENGLFVESVYVKEFSKSPEDKIQQGQLYKIKDTQSMKPVFSDVTILHTANVFWLAMADEIVLIKKKHKSYYTMDTVRKKATQIIMKLLRNGVLCGISSNLLEFSQLTVKQQKCSVQAFDMILFEIPQDYEFFELLQLEEEFLFIYKSKLNPSQMKLSITIKQDAMTKVVRCYNDNMDPEIVENLCRVLEISKRDFYLKLWYNSARELKDIRNKLLLCSHVPTIKEEIKTTLRKKATTIVQLIDIQCSYYQIVNDQLTLTLTPALIKQATVGSFLLRKLRTIADQHIIIGLKEFIEIKNKSLARMVEETIINERRFSQLNTRDRDRYKKTNPLILVKSENVIRELLYEFRYQLLQNYEYNLVEIIKPFGKDLEYIFEKYSFLLPIYPYNFSFISKELIDISLPATLISHKSTDDSRASNSGVGREPSNSIFAPMCEAQWMNETSIQEIRKRLLEYHPTSAVEEAICQVESDQDFRKTKLSRHGLIYSSMHEYVSNVQNSLSGTKLWLKIVEFYNLMNRNQQDMDELVQRLIDVFRRKNNLHGDDLTQIRLYGKLHCLFLAHNIDPIPSMEALTLLKSEELISLFFLGNRHKINLIFNQLKNVYDSLAQSYDSLFNKTLKEFIDSDSCSPVELRLLVFSLDQKGKNFQDTNQSLILVLLDGFCKRLEVGERDKIEEMADSLSNISLCLHLNQRIINIIKIKQLDQLFKQFKCEHETLYAVEFEGKRILSLILEQYFIHEMYTTQLNIEEEIISLESPRNMLNVLLYLQEQLYSESVSREEVILLFGDCLVDYEAFDVLRELIQEEPTLGTMGINPTEYAEAIIREAFIKLYRESGSFEEMKDHIYEILKLQVQPTQYLQQEMSRVQLCQLITDCDYKIHPSEVADQSNKVEFMLNFIQTGYANLSVEKIIQIYNCFRLFQGDQDPQVDSLLLIYIALFSKTCIKHLNIQSTLEGVVYLLRMDCISEIKSLITQTFLQYINSRFPQQSKQAMKIIEYFILNQDNKEVIISIFSDDFDITEEYENDESIIEINEVLHYVRLKNIDFHLEELREVARRIGNGAQLFYRYYFFGLAILMCPERVTVVDVNYDILGVDDLVDLLAKQLSNKKHYIGVNFNEYMLRRFFLNVLCQFGCHLTDQEEFKVEEIHNFEDELHLINMVEKLKEIKQSVLVRAIKKNIRFLQENRLLNENKDRKAKKYEQTITDQIAAITIETNLLTRRHEQKEMASRSMIDDGRGNKNMTLREFLSVTINASMNNPTLNERQINQIIREDNVNKTVLENRMMLDNRSILEEEPRKPVSPSRQRSMTMRHANFQQLETYLQQEYFELFQSRKYYEIESKDRQEMLRFLKEYYYTDREIGTFIKLLQGLKLGEERNIKIVQSAMRVNTPNINLKKLFKFDFYFYTANESTLSVEPKTSSCEFYSKIFQYLTPSIMELMRYDTWQMLSKIVCVSLKFQKEYEYRVIMFALESFVADVDRIDAQFLENMNEFLQKLSVSTMFLAQNYKGPFLSCESSEVQKEYLEAVVHYLKNPDQTVGRLEDSQKEFIESTIGEIQDCLRNGIDDD